MYTLPGIARQGKYVAGVLKDILKQTVRRRIQQVSSNFAAFTAPNLIRPSIRSVTASSSRSTGPKTPLHTGQLASLLKGCPGSYTAQRLGSRKGPVLHSAAKAPTPRAIFPFNQAAATRNA